MPPTDVTDKTGPFPSSLPPHTPNLVPPKRTILSPTIQQHWRRRGQGPFPFGSIFFQVKDPKERFPEVQYLANLDHSNPPLTQGYSSPTSTVPVPPLKVFTRIKLPEVMKMPIQPCIVPAKNVQLSIVANCKGRDMSKDNGVAQGQAPKDNTHSQAEWLLRPSGRTGV